MSKNRKFFGTDGVRGRVNSEVMNAEIAMKLGMAAGSIFNDRGKHRHRVIIGKDTRLSGYLFEPALTAGFISVGMDVILVGPMPTPAISMLTKSMRADFGVMISASHNAHYDNGIKFFDHEGKKLSDEVEVEIENRMISGIYSRSLALPENLGRAKRLDDAAGRYVQAVKTVFPKSLSLDDLRIVVDPANGAAYHLAATIFRELGAEVFEIAASPNGFNINNGCGATSTDLICQEVKEKRADIGLALDGDADRLVVIDENGNVVDGDILIASLAIEEQKKGNLCDNKIVTTIVSNLAIDEELAKFNISVARSKVGDRYVSEEMSRVGANFGGEKSGHIIFSDHCTTGDGMIAALKFLEIMVRHKKKVSEICAGFSLYEQINQTISIEKIDLSSEKVTNFFKELNEKFQNGRVLVRKSGTEPIVRILVEGKDSSEVKNKIAEINQFLQEH